MPTTPDPPDGRRAGSEDRLAAAEEANLAARDTVPLDTRAPAPRRGSSGVEFDLLVDLEPSSVRDTVPLRPRRDSASPDPARRDTVPLDPSRRDSGPVDPARRDSEALDPARRGSGVTDDARGGAASGDPARDDIDPARRDTVSIDPRSIDRDTAPGDAASRDTVRVDAAMLARRETVRLPRRPARRPRAPLAVAAGFATLWAALLTYLPVAAVIGLARSFEGAGGLAGAAKAGLAGWLLGHGVPLGTRIGPLALAPLLLTALVVWRLNRAGLHVTRAVGARRTGSVRAALQVAGAVGVAYALLGAAAAAVVDGPGTTVPVGRAALTFLAIGTGAALFGALRGTDAVVPLALRIPAVLRHGLRTGVVAALLVLAAGAGFAGLSVAVGGGQAADTIAAYRTGVAGQAGITLVSLAYGVNGAVWAAAYLLGPGFLLGTGTAVRLTEVTVGPLPTLPLLAGLPNGPMGAGGAALLAVPVLAGMVAGALLTRRLARGRTAAPGQPSSPPAPSWPLVIGSALAAGPVAGLILGVLSRLSGGSLGAGRMAQIGPVAWQVGLVAAGVVAVSATLGAAAARAWRSTADHR
ncbi:DUF6350 family protein [Krasilnikovia sp. MM14-A1259]|uniref:cell division protein PerM n=1 Tax=Krasilnikovia sp. MM14-A1259 TaxID=3373539 RepID=UPI00381193B3